MTSRPTKKKATKKKATKMTAAAPGLSSGAAAVDERIAAMNDWRG